MLVRRSIKQRKDAAEKRLCHSHMRQALLDASEELCPAAACGIESLPADLLVQIFQNLDQKACRKLLPLVCRSWHELLSKPTAIWNHLDVDFEAEAEAVEAVQPQKRAMKVRSQRILSWLIPRAPAVRSLRMLGLPPPAPSAAPGLSMVSAAQQMLPIHDFTTTSLLTMLEALSGSLEELLIERCSTILYRQSHLGIAVMTNLRVLSLKGIRLPLGEADTAAITGLPHLAELVLDCDQPPEVDAGSPEVIWGLQSFPEPLAEMSNMTHMTLSCHYGVTQLPTHVSKLNKLEVLNLDFCTLSALPPSLGKLTRLTTLDVEGNLYLGDHYRPAAMRPALDAFPSELSSLTALKYININSCGLTALPKVITTLRNLETLDMEDNEFGLAGAPDCGLPNGLAQLTRLQCLNVAACKLDAVPRVVERMGSLRILDLTNNSISNAGLPSGLSALRHLKAIGLKNNRLTAVPRVLGTVRSLQEIYLEDNADMEVQDMLDFIVDLPALRVVMMGKQEGRWAPQSMHFMTDFASKLKARHPTHNILRISYAGEQRMRKDGESL